MTFEDLKSWQNARQLTREIYTLTRQGELVKIGVLLSSIFNLL